MTLSIEEISDRLEINDIYTRYAHAADDKDLSALDRIFLPHTTFDWSAAGGGVMTFAEAKTDRNPVFTGKLFPWAFHVVTNVRIDFADDGRAATVKVKTINPSGLEDVDGKPMMFQTHGAYVDQLAKTADGWRIMSRVWQEFWIVGPLEKISGIPGMLKAAGRQTDA